MPGEMGGSREDKIAFLGVFVQGRVSRGRGPPQISLYPTLIKANILVACRHTFT